MFRVRAETYVGSGNLKHTYFFFWPHHMKTLVVFKYPMLYTKFQGHRPLGSQEEDFEVFHHLWAWSCDPDHLNKLSFPYPTEDPHEIGFNRSSGF